MKISRIRADSGIPIWKNSIILMMILIGSLHPSAASNKHPHYTFALPDRYIGWVQVVFNDPQASPLPRRDHGYLIEVPESGISRTSDIRVEDYKAKDEFYYRVSLPNGTTALQPVPPDYIMAGDTHGGFGVMDTGGRGQGYSWFLFIGPPELRVKVPLADWNKVVEEYKKLHQGSARVEAPAIYPEPGRMQSIPPAAGVSVPDGK